MLLVFCSWAEVLVLSLSLLWLPERRGVVSVVGFWDEDIMRVCWERNQNFICRMRSDSVSKK